MLLGRAGEIGRLDDLLDGATHGHGGTLLVVGVPGIGKTALLDAAARRASRRHVRVLRARAVEGSVDLPFSLVEDLHVAAGQQRPAVSGVAQHADALTDLLASLSRSGPLLVAVDDAHNADRGSLAVLARALGRVSSLGVAGVVAARPQPGVGDTVAAWPRVELHPLSDDAATAVLRSVLGADIDPGVAQSLAVALQGLPLALHEATRLLTADQLAGRAPLPDPLPIAPALMSAWLGVVERLPDASRLSLVDLAVAGPRPDLVAALADRGGWGPDDLDAAVSAALVTPGTPPEFVHPLVRDVVLRGAPAALLRDRYAVAAEQARALDMPPALVVGFLARSVVLADGLVADAVAEQAERAESLGYLDAACRAWAIAARLSVTSEERVDRALRGVRLAARFDLGVEGMVPLLDLLAGVRLDPEAAGWVSWLRAVQRADVDPGASLTAQWAAIDEARRTAPAVLPVLFWDAAMAAWTLGRPDLGLRAAREAAELDPDPGPAGSGRPSPPWTGRALLAAALIQAGEVADGVALRTAVLAEAAAVDPQGMDRGALLDAVFLDDLLLDDGAAGAHRLAVAEDRLANAPEPLSCLWGIEAWRARADGEWEAARALLARARPLADSSGASGASRGLAALATELAAACADTETLQREAQALRVLTDRWCDRRRRATHDRALGLRALLDGRLDEAASRLTEAADVGFLGRGLRDGVIPARVDLVEAHVRRGDPGRAGEWHDRVRPLLQAFGGPLATGLAYRIDALVAPTVEDADAAYRTALAAHAESPEAFEHARTLLLHGEHLRRTRRRGEARAALAQSAQLFARLGASPWRARAEDERRACGGDPGTTSAGSLDDLTPQERAVALAVCAGRTNQEAADYLSLSPRTVEHHLSNAYRKLGVRGRANLARALGRQEAPTA
ncbi:MAG: LuxR family transcriptional regulator [Candidatus Nanopelagicales bacterium]